MRALRCHTFGGPEVLSLDEVDAPQPGPGEVVVDVRACGLNFADTERRRGLYLADQPLPDTLGFEGAGEVATLGPDVDAAWLSRRVAFLAPRAHATQCVVPVTRLMPLPDGLDFVQGAAFPVQWLTAWHVLHTVGRVQPGERVLVHGAAGGVGLALVQLAREAGAHVIGTVSREGKQALVEARGAHEVLVRPAQPDAPVQLVLEGLGADVVDATLQSLAPFGRWVHFGTASGPLPANLAERLFERSLTFSSYWLRTPHAPTAWQGAVDAVVARLLDGRATLDVTTAPLHDAARWHRRLEGSLTTGKVVLVP